MRKKYNEACQAPKRMTLKLCGLVTAVLCAGPLSALAQTDYPNRSILINVPFSAGGTTDLLARAIGHQLSEKWRVPVVVENKPGAGGNIGTAQVARAAPDGYTLVMGTIGTHAINPSLYKTMPYDAVNDFVPITRTAMVSNALVVPPDAPYNTVPELIAYGKQNPGKLTFGSSGHGSTLQMSGETFKMMTGMPMDHVPYKGSAPAVADLLGGHISMIFDNLPSALPYIQSGKLKVLAVTAPSRVEQLPEVPTIAEAGVDGYGVTSWFGLWAPKNTPPQVVKKLNETIVEIIESPEMQKIIRSQGAVPHPETSAEFAAFIDSETKLWREVVQKANLTIQ